MADSAGQGGISGLLSGGQDVTIGLAGPDALVERIVLAAGLPGPAGRMLRAFADDSGARSARCRLLPAAYADEQTAPDRVARLGKVDACLFASPAPLTYARRAGVLSCPAVHIQLADGPLIATLLRAARAGLDPARASFDTLSRLEVTRALAEIGVTTHRVHVREEIPSPPALASYHSRLWQLRQTSVAITCLEEVSRRLTASNVPVLTLRPSDHSIAAALRTAILLGERQAAVAARLAVVLVEVPELRGAASERMPRLAREELRLSVHSLLVRQAAQLSATVSPVSEHAFLVTATVGSLADAAGYPPFAAAAAAELGVDLEVAVGTGRTAGAAEEAARKGLGLGPRQRSAAGRDRRAGQDEARLTEAVTSAGRPAASDKRPGAAASLVQLPVLRPQRTSAAGGQARYRTHSSSSGSPDSVARLRSLETLALLARKLTAGANPVVDAELTGQLLSVTPRTARRQLRALAEEGLALPLPPRRSQHPGRPRQAYRLVVEELEGRAAQ